MKNRYGFVSNSSSSSFVIKDKNKISPFQYEKIMNHREIAGRYAWDITETDTSLECETYMNNFDLEEYVRILGVTQYGHTSSFVIKDKTELSELQYQRIINHAEIAGDNAWDIGEAEKSIFFSTNCKNFDLYGYVLLLGVDGCNVTYEQEEE